MSDQKLWDYHQNQNRDHLICAYPRQNMLFNKIKKLIPSGKFILENGFGDGYLLNKLSKSWYKVVGQDISQENINITKKQWNNINIDFLLGDVSWTILANNESLDWYIASEVLEHMTDEELPIHVKEMHRTLKSGWYGFLTFPAKENLKINECMCPECGKVFHKRWHKQYRDEKKIRHVFKDFKILTIKTFVSRVKWNSVLSSFVGYLKVIGSHVLGINKSYLVIIKK